MILFGNKSDLDEERQVDYDEGIQLGNNLGCKYYEGSARTGENINFIMNEIAKISYFEWKKTEENRMSIRLSMASVGSEKINPKKNNCCKK